jgi:hemerythrin
MALITWRDSYSVKVPSIDEQHKKLIDLINRLHDAMSSGQGKAVLGGVVAELVAYTRTHFTYEESLMSRAIYPQLTAHRAAHRSLIEKVGGFTAQVGADATTTIEMMTFLRGWLMEHIQKEDMAYSDSLVAKGIQ